MRLDPKYSILMMKLYADLHSASDWLLIGFEFSRANNDQSEPALECFGRDLNACYL